jgi:hypothetical protein
VDADEVRPASQWQANADEGERIDAFVHSDAHRQALLGLIAAAEHRLHMAHSEGETGAEEYLQHRLGELRLKLDFAQGHASHGTGG